tara:strand:+ start:865 stop:1005 length:141 start_codon:yes stop_codon:yes gene_type:complete
MKLKALLLGLLIAGATALTYTATQDNSGDYAEKQIRKSRIIVPKNG